jgi:hypothetical protein
VNANVLVKPDKRVFEKFPKEILDNFELIEQGYSNFKFLTQRYYIKMAWRK